MVLERYNWTEEVQKALTIPPSLKGDAKEMGRTPAFDVLCGKASNWIPYLPDIPKLEKQFRYLRRYSAESEYEHEEEDEDEDEDEKQRWKEKMNKKKQTVLEKTERMFKIMGDIAVDIGIPHYIEFIQNFYYDIEKGTKYTRMDGSRFYVNRKDLSDAQKKLSPFAYLLAHPSPEE
jgi:hypothetical protein